MLPSKFLAAGLVVLSYVTAAPAQSRPQPIHFHLVRGFAILAQGEISGLGHLNLLIDTGAVPSVLSQRLATKLGAHGTSGDLSLLSGQIQAQYITVKDVRLSWAHRETLDMVVVDLAPLEERLGTPIDAIVGLDFFANQDFFIDYEDATIRPGLSGHSRHSAAAEILYASAAPYWVLSTQCNGAVTRLLLDTGADDLTLFADAAASVRRAAHQNARLRFLKSAPGDCVTDSEVQLVLGDVSFAKQRHGVTPRPPGASGDLDGLLGPTALHLRRLEFDWENRLLWWDRK